MWEDPIVQEVRLQREKLSTQFDFDVHAIFDDLRKRQCTHGARLIRPKDREAAGHVAAPDRASTVLHPGR
jgi:hypothetical protein